ncbi:circularin A/uberolysin family circular bacteriocin [Lachnotalea glycerini]|uniref:Circular bacteriocin, circularin A/uberolysin family n=1 Tax=Lachnotalea glycerini TaxID=1763509 RepID=A0A255I5U7_9FIRM|nr:uberolysin/carnocyclin family circular bacteriocin [Lachnotalea glycerini]PXV91041.1 circularin A/uberolysin family circular bacteriocin [Lachnotalea glycerini]RDY28461.1 circular bacteriocin, circularin A/uberolysin family [Lachnotalea glycerini]
MIGTYLMDLAGYLGIASGIAQKVVDAIDWGGAAFVVLSILGTVMSAGALGAASASIDFIILTVKSYISRSLKAQAVVW